MWLNAWFYYNCNGNNDFIYDQIPKFNLGYLLINGCILVTWLVTNVASYGFLKKRLETHNLHIHALWFDIYTGDIYYFSRGEKRFVQVDEENAERIIEEINRFYS